MRLKGFVRAGIAVACATSLVAAPLLVPTAVSAVSTEAAAKTLTIKVAKKAITVRGANGLHPGRVKIHTTGKGTAEIVMFKRGYGIAQFSKDVAAVDKGNIKALKRALAHTQFLGGVQPGSTGTVVLPKAGDYTVFSFSSKGHAQFSAHGAKRTRTPAVDGTIVGERGPAWGGSDQLPASGTFAFRNADRTTPHFVIMQQVAEGTTTDQVLQFLQSGEEADPPWALPAGLETASLSPGRSMTVDYDLPPGQYVLMCFFPDPHMQGMPHALMGMLKMVHLS